MSEVIDFPTPDRAPRAWVCACGGTTFFISEDATMTCTACDTTSDAGVWVEKLKVADFPEPTIRRTVMSGQGEDFGKHRVVKYADSPDSFAIIVICDNGASYTWVNGGRRDDDRVWTKKQLLTAVDAVMDEPLGGEEPSNG